MNTKRKTLVFLSIILILLFVVSCDLFEDKSNGVADVKFVASKEGSTKSLSTGDGANAVPFSELTGHKIRLVCSDGTGYCSLSGATAGFVAWPSENVSLGYGKWTVYAQGYKGSDKYYENTSGVEFIVGPKGVLLDSGSTWGSSVSITESYCGTDSAKIKVNSSLTVKDEAENTVSLVTGDYAGYQLKWYKTTVSNPTNLSTARTVAELTASGTGFTEWTDPTTAIEAGSHTYVVVAIVNKTTPSTIFGSVSVKLENLSAGQVYTIGSGASDYVQFGKYGVEFKEPEEKPYFVGETGPAGGIIIYDKGYVSNGWRYLESAPAELRMINGIPSVDTTAIGYSTGTATFLNGYKKNNEGTLQFFNLSSALGYGESNTRKLISTENGVKADRSDSKGSEIVDYSAPGMCSLLEFGGASDWFLPSKEEMSRLYYAMRNKDFNIIEPSHSYGTSSEDKANHPSAPGWYWVTLGIGEQYSYKDNPHSIIPIRSFDPEEPLGHHYVATVTTPATCTTDGTIEYTCSVCGVSYTETIHALGHDVEDGICKRCEWDQNSFFLILGDMDTNVAEMIAILEVRSDKAIYSQGLFLPEKDLILFGFPGDDANREKLGDTGLIPCQEIAFPDYCDSFDKKVNFLKNTTETSLHTAAFNESWNPPDTPYVHNEYAYTELKYTCTLSYTDVYTDGLRYSLVPSENYEFYKRCIEYSYANVCNLVMLSDFGSDEILVKYYDDGYSNYLTFEKYHITDDWKTSELNTIQINDTTKIGGVFLEMTIVKGEKEYQVIGFPFAECTID